MDVPRSAAVQELPQAAARWPVSWPALRWPRNDLFLYVLLIALTMVRIGATWRVFSQTTDEPIHFLTGYVWLAEGQYTITPDHPPLARVLAALPLWLAGARDSHERDFGERINRMLLTGNRYEHNLALIRCGNLVFVLLAIAGVAVWARRVLTPPWAFLATALFASLPPVLAHGGLATTDMAACGTFAIAIAAFYRWLDTPSAGRALVLGVAAGLGAVSKFSFLPFFGAAAVAILAVRALRGAELDRFRREGWRSALHLLLAGAVTTAIVLLMYRGDWRTFIYGIRIVAAHAKEGHTAYLFGQRSQHGWWYYFPVALLFKTPLPFLALALIGFGRRHLDAIAVAAVILVIAISTPINIGIRHLLPIYVPLALLAGAGAERLASVARSLPRGTTGRLAAGALAVLCGWMFAGTLLSHPDYIPWFNELALDHGERILSDSNFDWGQDILRLRKVCRERHIDSLAFEVFTGAPLDEIGLPPRRKIRTPMPTAGWHAISETVMTAAGGEGAYAYVTRHPMVCRAGKTIRLYYVK
jgi:4-amino-4-deoxy-L-arabinose transferase-like glycosyltransferase